MLQQMRGVAKYIWLFIVIAFVGGFLLAETSGLIGRATLTPTTAVAEVNGEEILYDTWQRRVQQATQNQQRSGSSLTQDEIRQIENDVLDEMIMEVLLKQEFDRRGIRVTNEELREFARYAPPPFMYNNPDLQTEGRFDPQKYARLLASPQARQQGLLVALEQYYRSEVPREKLFEQVTDGVYLTDADLWRAWQDERDSASVSYVAWRPTVDSAATAAVTTAEARAYFDANKADFDRPGRAVLSVLRIPRVINAADSAATRARVASLRAEITGGASFEEVARRESEDTISGPNGGDLGRGARGRFVPEFESAAYALRAGEISQPVLSPFGYHLIRVDERKGDTLALRHILIRVQQSDSAATAVDRRADDLARIAADATDGSRLDSASRQLGLPVTRATATEGQPATVGNMMVPSASAWAFGGAQPGEVSELFDDDNGYWIARLDSLVRGEPEFERYEGEIRSLVARDKALAALIPTAQQFATRAASTSLEAAAAAANMTIAKTPMFTRLSFVPALGQYSKPIGAAFGLSVGAVSAPIQDDAGVYVMRVDRRVNADRSAFEAQKAGLRAQRLQQLKQQRLQLFLQDLRKSASIEDHRRDIDAMIKRLQT